MVYNQHSPCPQVGQGQPDVEVALSMGQDSLDKVEGDKYNPLVKVHALNSSKPTIEMVVYVGM